MCLDWYSASRVLQCLSASAYFLWGPFISLSSWQLTADLCVSAAFQLNAKLRVRALAPGRRSALVPWHWHFRWEADLSMWIINRRNLVPGTLLVSCCRRHTGVLGGASSKEPARQSRRLERRGFDPWFGKIHWRRKWQPIPVFLPWESHGQRNLAGYSPWGHTELDTTEAT